MNMVMKVRTTELDGSPALKFHGRLNREATRAVGKLMYDSGQDHTFELDVDGTSVSGTVAHTRLAKFQPIVVTVEFEDETSQSFHCFDRDDLSDDWAELAAQDDRGQLGSLGCDPHEGCAPQ